MKKTICIFGDSTAWGAWDKEKGGWVNRLWVDISNREKYFELYNLSISGDTSKSLLNRFENEAENREPDIIIIQTGGNDASYEKTAGNFLVLPDEFAKNLQVIVNKAKKIGENIILMGFENVDETKTKPVSWREIHYTNDNIKKYNKIINDTCKKNDVLFLDIFGLLNDDDFEDGIHPNSKGHEKIYKKVKNFMALNGIIANVD